jgi:hypothetical protein
VNQIFKELKEKKELPYLKLKERLNPELKLPKEKPKQ